MARSNSIQGHDEGCTGKNSVTSAPRSHGALFHSNSGLTIGWHTVRGMPNCPSLGHVLFHVYKSTMRYNASG
jgi:hypothetical protein